MRTLVNFALRREPAVIRILFFLGPLLTLLVPKATVAIIVLLSLCCIGLALARGGDIKSLFRIDITLALFAVTALYLFLNASWSLDPERAFSKAVWFTLVVAMSYGAAARWPSWPKRSLQMAAYRLSSRRERRSRDHLVRNRHGPFPHTLGVQVPAHHTAGQPERVRSSKTVRS